MIQEAIDMLGLKARDKVTGFTGVITTCGFDLFGCITVILSPPADAEGKLADGRWFDINRLDVTDERVMPVPQFEAYAKPVLQYDRGAAEKPLPPSGR